MKGTLLLMRLPVLGLLAVALIALVAAPTAHAAKVPCVVGQKSPKCKVWTAKVKWAADGDTLRPRIKERGRWTKRTVRMSGIQAPELSGYSRKRGRKGNCLGVKATETLERFIKKRTVRLVAMRGGSTTEGRRTRLRRTIQVKKGGRWVDPAMTLLEKGLVLWFPNGSDEWAWNGVYGRLAQKAAAKGVGLYNPTACGKAGPSQSSELSLKVKWDAAGTDSKKTANGEWVRIKNADPVNDVSLRGWTLRDSQLRGQKLRSGYRFPPTAVVPAGGSITVKVGRGSNRNGTYFWGLNEIIFDNATNNKKQIGDGAYLFDPHSELRAYTIYPCRVSCSEPLKGKVSVKARYMGAEHEWVTIKNTSSSTFSLNEYELESVPWFWEFGPRDVLAPGKETIVWVNQPHRIPVDLPGGRRIEVNPALGISPFQDAVSFKAWGHKKSLFGDKSDTVTLRNPLGAPVTCHAWGRGERCPGV
jgi:endonuclease YncB( thermonuclease family)